ncbi:hypothetical protein F3Y22_tig00110163pilonHSYRG00247 [Hibiscus syriacus]|uniref:DUF641 domain-containing protein n=1 Tax=Hibiscus syriacus TaxID=106335 RepID=A0A6A3BFS9_HIBSY|nr:hypothetical protein F3Y22_tig00110163pilonHSYRG00247 [Hibiscus syriacus]
MGLSFASSATGPPVFFPWAIRAFSTWLRDFPQCTVIIVICPFIIVHIIKTTETFNNDNHKSKLARTFQRVVNLITTTKIASSNGIENGSHSASDVNRRGAALEALVAMVFASFTSIKAAYAELQMVQNPYNSDAIQAADQVVVEQLKVFSELKHKFLKHELDVSPQVSLMLAEIQEQQSLMCTAEINIKKLEYDIERKVVDIALHHKQLKDCTFLNRSMEKKLNEIREVDDEGDGESKMGC